MTLSEVLLVVVAGLGAGVLSSTVGVASLLNLVPALLLKAIVDHLQGVLDHSTLPRPRLLFLLCAGLVAAPLVAQTNEHPTAVAAGHGRATARVPAPRSIIARRYRA